MTNTLEIGKVLFNKLKEIPEIEARVFPIIAENGTNYPFIIYTRNSISSTSCKDGFYEDVVAFTIEIVSATYFDGIDIAQKVRTIIEHIRSEEDMRFSNVQLTSASESYSSESYVQTLQFTATID